MPLYHGPPGGSQSTFLDLVSSINFMHSVKTTAQRSSVTPEFSPMCAHAAGSCLARISRYDAHIELSCRAPLEWLWFEDVS